MKEQFIGRVEILNSDSNSKKIILDADGKDGRTIAIGTIVINGDSGNIFAGGSGDDGDLVLRSKDAETRIRLNAQRGKGLSLAPVSAAPVSF